MSDWKERKRSLRFIWWTNGAGAMRVTRKWYRPIEYLAESLNGKLVRLHQRMCKGKYSSNYFGPRVALKYRLLARTEYYIRKYILHR